MLGLFFISSSMTLLQVSIGLPLDRFLGQDFSIYTPKLCVPTFQADFERPVQHENDVPRITFQGRQVGQFRGTDDLVIKAFAQSGFHTDHFQIDFRVYPTEQPPSSRGQRVAVVTNADCDTIESVSITMDTTNFYFRIFQMGITAPAEITIPFAGLKDANGWYTVRLVYTGQRGNYRFSATVGSRTVSYKGPVELTSKLTSFWCFRSCTCLCIRCRKYTALYNFY
ncbi:hypothetical protein ElyMa_002300500 [Elysia marginata]|uniref:Uncharacterized protein n=1 Tax=Elysia marginata TaxID=1093978 RepID=A0AAV4G3U8_9GAST|nr:hypothetical protein ElyMa_002300500 [Elysia marginata]